MTDQPRTETQNRSLHLYFTHLAEALNEAGLDMRKILKPSIDIPWTPKSIKEFLWRPIMKAQLGVDSTKDLTTKDIDKVFDTLNRHLSEKFGLTVSFPSVDTLIMENHLQGRG